MANRHTALTSILIEGGLSPSKANHIERTLDRLRLCNLGADDIAAVLLQRDRFRTPYKTLTPQEHNAGTLWGDDKQLVLELGRGE